MMSRLAVFACAAILFVAVAPLPYGYYQFVRLAATVGFGWAAWAASRNNADGHLVICVGAALLFNPVVPVHLSRPVWMVADIVAAGYLLVNMSVFAPRPGSVAVVQSD